MASSFSLGALAAGLALLTTAGAVAGQSGVRDRDSLSASRITGVVYDHERGQPLPNVSVVLAGDRGERDVTVQETNARGRFSFMAVDPGPYVVTVASLGYVTRRDSLLVEAASDHDLVLELSIDPIPLEPVMTVVPLLPSSLRGFRARRERGGGTFIDRQEIEVRSPALISDLLRRVPGGQMTPLRNGGYALKLRGGCEPSVWIDGIRTVDSSASGIGVDQAVSPEDVEAIEVYRGSGSVPIQFGPDPCGAVVIWTRPARRDLDGPDNGFWHQLAIIGGFVGLAVLLSH